MRIFAAAVQKRKIFNKNSAFLKKNLRSLRIFGDSIQKRKENSKKWENPCVMKKHARKNAKFDFTHVLQGTDFAFLAVGRKNTQRPRSVNQDCVRVAFNI